mmetsp:Transcript_19416/g.56393  ORF Transcript_19416/g.56393 Transcript_19416/m.56393 type:complete len:209 (+) Transcript_19416:1887-2513(+)
MSTQNPGCAAHRSFPSEALHVNCWLAEPSRQSQSCNRAPFTAAPSRTSRHFVGKFVQRMQPSKAEAEEVPDVLAVPMESSPKTKTWSVFCAWHFQIWILLPFASEWSDTSKHTSRCADHTNLPSPSADTSKDWSGFSAPHFHNCTKLPLAFLWSWMSTQNSGCAAHRSFPSEALQVNCWLADPSRQSQSCNRAPFTAAPSRTSKHFVG